MASCDAQARALEGFTHLTRDLAVQSDPALFVRRAQELVLTNGAITGVRAQHGGGEVEFTATRGVILASGGFGANEFCMQNFKSSSSRSARRWFA